MSESITERVERGIALLDTHRPGWHRDINLTALDITSVRCCVLGQLYGYYYKGTEELGFSSRADDMFDVTFDDKDDDGAALQAEWSRRIAELQAGEARDE